jgi:hypothetical protein
MRKIRIFLDFLEDLVYGIYISFFTPKEKNDDADKH